MFHLHEGNSTFPVLGQKTTARWAQKSSYSK